MVGGVYDSCSVEVPLVGGLVCDRDGHSPRSRAARLPQCPRKTISLVRCDQSTFWLVFTVHLFM